MLLQLLLVTRVFMTMRLVLPSMKLANLLLLFILSQNECHTLFRIIRMTPSLSRAFD